MYYEYWGMKKAPFDNVPDPSLYWSENNSLEDAISEILFAIEEGNDCLAVLTGKIGSGKTLGLRIILNELDPEKYRIAFITNPDLSSVQLMREIIGQLKNKKITNRYKDQLLEELNTTLFDCANKGQKVIIFIDEANVMNTAQLHNLRLMTNLQDDQQNMIIFVLAGQEELGKRLESKALENLYQRIGVYCRVKGLTGPETVQQYLSHRIKICEGSPEIFSPEAYEAIWLHSGQGVPRLINKIAKLCLKAGETNQIKKIDAEMVHTIASMFERVKPLLPQIPQQKNPAKNKKPPSQSDNHKVFSPVTQTQFHGDAMVIDLIEGLSPQIRNQLQSMEDKQLVDLAGKMAIQLIQKKGQKSADDPVIVWHSIKGRIYSALKSIQEPKRYHIGTS